MQPDRFTTKAQEAIAAAQQLALQRRNPEIAPAHLLVALLQQEDGLVPPILQRLGADTAAVAARANEAVAALPKLSGEGEEPRMSSALAQVVRQAEKEMAKKSGDEYISTDHLLLALTGDSSTAEILPDRGSLEEAIAEVRPRPVTSPEPESTAAALEKFGRDLTAEAERGKLDPVIGRTSSARAISRECS
jgi:ATP-dependent Clp protease ATP-binding subunit ClpB